MGQISVARRPAGSLVLKLSDALRDAILGGEFQPGDKLPSEAKLTEHYGVSRTVVREAIATLRIESLVEARQGAGVFVRDMREPSDPLRRVERAKVTSALEILEIRTPIEIEAAGLAASRRSPAQEEDILERHGAVVACTKQGAPIREADFALHLAIAQATNNPHFAEFLIANGQTAIPKSEIVTRSRAEAERSYHGQLNAEHERIVLAISRGDADEAREAMRAHLKGSQERHRELLHRGHIGAAALSASQRG